MRNLLVVLAFAVLLSATGAAQDLPFPGSEPVRRLWNIQFELVRVKGGLGFITYPDYLSPAGTRLGGWAEIRFPSLSVECWRFRAGTSYGAGYLGLQLEGQGDVGFGSFFPVRVGYTLFQRPIEYEESGVFRGMLPDVFAEVELNWLTIEADSPIWKGGVCAEADNYGGGVGAEVAVFYAPGHKPVPTASVYLRLATNLGF